MKTKAAVILSGGAALIFGVVFLLNLPTTVLAQSGAIQVQAPAAEPIPVRSNGELDSLVSPIALYPDPLLSQVLVASTYPLEVVQASQWLQQNSSLSGTALQDAARQQNWDPSIQALILFPDVLRRLADNIQWTTDLGNAFLAQQSGVMDAVQRMRNQAMASGNLQSNAQVTVQTEAQGPATVVEILPANPQVIYVPYYDPLSIWGPPIYYPYPLLRPYRTGIFVSTRGIYWPGGIFVGGYFSGWSGWAGWGWRPNWFGRTVIVNNNFFNRYGYRHYVTAGVVHAPTAVWHHDGISRDRFSHEHGVNRSVAGAHYYDNSRPAVINRAPQAAPFRPQTPAPGFSRERVYSSNAPVNRPAFQGSPNPAAQTPSHFYRSPGVVHSAPAARPPNVINNGKTFNRPAPPAGNFQRPAGNTSTPRGGESFRGDGHGHSDSHSNGGRGRGR